MSDLLLHVIDASDPRIDEKIEIVNKTLQQIQARNERVLVFNKIDLLSHSQLAELQEKYKDLNPMFVSAQSGI